MLSIKKTARVVSGTGWVRPNKAKTKNKGFARTSTSNAITFSSFGYNIPQSAVITGIKIETTRKGSRIGMSDSVSLLIPGGDAATGFAADIPINLRKRTNGGENQIPGYGMVTPTQINSSDFGILYSKVFAGIVYLDAIEVTVFYNVPAPIFI